LQFTESLKPIITKVSLRNRLWLFIGSLVTFAAPIGLFIGIVMDSNGYFGRPTFAPLFTAIFGKAGVIVLGLFILAFTGTFWGIAIRMLRGAFRK
jgi:hypothetical protein